jgi:hypothetical protein
VTAKDLAAGFEKLVGSRVELWSFRLDFRDGAVILTPTDSKQDFIVEGTPPRIKDLETDPNPIYILVVSSAPPAVTTTRSSSTRTGSG